jgi:hypothetical protein
MNTTHSSATSSNRSGLVSQCQKVITQQIAQMPPLLQEQIIGTTLTELEQQAAKRIKADVQEEIYAELSLTLPFLVSQMFNNLFDSTVNHAVARTDFQSQYPSIPSHLIHIAALTTEETMRSLDHRLIHCAFELAGHANQDNSDMSESDSSLDYNF